MEPNAHFADEESPGKLSSNQINCKISQECYGFEQINFFFKHCLGCASFPFRLFSVRVCSYSRWHQTSVQHNVQYY